MLRRVGAVFSVFREAFRNPALRRVSGAYALFVTAEFGIWITLLVFAYDHGGASAITVMVLVQLLPCIVLAPVIGAFVDLSRPSGVLRVGYALQAISMAGVAAAIGAGAPTVVVFVLAPLTAISLTMTRSPHAAVLPAVVRTPDEFTAANVMTGWADGLASLVGPAFAGLLLSVNGAGTAVAANATMSMLALLMVVRVEGPAAARMAEVVDAPGGTEDRPNWISRAAAQVARQASALRTVTSANVVTALRDPHVRVLLALHTFYFVIIGTLDLMCVVLAVDTLQLGPGGAGYLNAALGGGALLALLVTAFLVGRRRLSNTLTSALVMAVVALALISAVPHVVPVVLLICAVGLAGAVFDTTGRTLLQRSAPSDAIAGTYSILESLLDLGVVLGAILVRVALAIGGVKAALLAPAVCAVLLLAVLWRRLKRIDSSATVPQVEIQLLRSIPIFAALPAPSIEGLARQLVPVTVEVATVVIREGEAGDCYYAVADGELAISRSERHLKTVSRGDGFGEIALVHDVLRTATVTALTPALLYSLQKEPFVEVLTGHVAASSAVQSLIVRRLDEQNEAARGRDGEGTGTE